MPERAYECGKKDDHIKHPCRRVVLFATIFICRAVAPRSRSFSPAAAEIDTILTLARLLPERAIACSKLQSLQAPFAIVILSAAIHICRTMYLLGGSAAILIGVAITTVTVNTLPMLFYYQLI